MSIRSLSFSCLLLTLPAVAQDVAGAPAAATPKSQVQHIVVSMSFAGGTLADFCAQIRAAEPRANIVVATLAADAQLPAMQLRGAGLEQALEGACAVAQSPMLIRMKDFRGPGEPVFTIMAQEQGQAAANGRPPAAGNPVAASSAKARPEVSEVYSLNRLLEAKDTSGFAVTTVLSAIEAAVGERQLATLRFHKESGLLILRGTQDQVALVRDVLGSLERDVMDRRKLDAARKGSQAEPAKDQAK